MSISNVFQNLAWGAARKSPRIEDRKRPNINLIWDRLRSSIPGVLACSACQLLNHVRYKFRDAIGAAIVSLTIALGGISSSLEGCTGIKLTAKDGSVVNGRTLEFGVEVEVEIVVIPRGYEFTSTTPNGPGLAYKAKYGAVGAIAFNHLAIMDGMNEKGLAVGVFYFPGFAGYSPTTKENQSKSMAPIEFPNWILTQFATIEEVSQALSSVFIAPVVTKEWGNTPPPFHYIVYDKTGKALVIEPMGGKLITYHDPLGTFTNSPTFDWHMTNLRNYINLTPLNANPTKLNGVELIPFGQGSGMVGIPGDFTPPSRFIRAAIYSSVAIPSKNADEAILQLFHILNQFDIPIGVARSKVDEITYSDYTQVTSAKDPQALKYYFKTYDDQSIHVVDLKKFNLDEKMVKKASTHSQQPIIDVTSTLK